MADPAPVSSSTPTIQLRIAGDMLNESAEGTLQANWTTLAGRLHLGPQLGGGVTALSTSAGSTIAVPTLVAGAQLSLDILDSTTNKWVPYVGTAAQLDASKCFKSGDSLFALKIPIDVGVRYNNRVAFGAFVPVTVFQSTSGSVEKQNPFSLGLDFTVSFN